MKNFSISTLLVGASVCSVSLFAQTATNSNVQSFTNADLNPNPPSANATQNQAAPVTPAATTDTTNTNQNAPFKYPALSQDQLQQITDQMSAQIQNAEQRVQNLMNRVQDPTRMPMSIDKVELEGAIMDLDVKKTLVSKFANSPSLKSPKVRQVLFQILAKDYIQESDLAALQAIVNEERQYTYP